MYEMWKKNSAYMYIYLIALIGYIFMDVELVRLYVSVYKFCCLNFLTSAACACVSKIFYEVDVLNVTQTELLLYLLHTRNMCII